MKKRFERFLSSSLLLSILLVLIANLMLILTNISPQIIKQIWNIALIISWVLMLIYPLYILMEKETRSFSILIAIVSISVFVLLSYHALLIISEYIPVIPKYIAVDGRITDNWQKLLYTGLILMYALHIINLILLKRLRSKDLK